MRHAMSASVCVLMHTFNVSLELTSKICSLTPCGICSSVERVHAPFSVIWTDFGLGLGLAWEDNMAAGGSIKIKHY